MNYKVAGFMMSALGIMGYFMADGMPMAGAGGTFSKEACVRSVQRQADKDLFSTVDPAGFCGCLADMKLTTKTASLETVQPCLDKHLKDPIINACEKDERDRAARASQTQQVNEMNEEEAPLGPSMNCQCVYEESSKWVWANFDAAMHSKKLKPEEAKSFADNMIKTCEWK